MKYTRMLCWVRPHEKKELKEAVNGQFPLVFAKNYDDFKSKICEGDYLVVSLSKARFGIKKLQELVRNFVNNKFHLYQLCEYEEITYSEFKIMDELNVVDGQYGAKELSGNFLEIIDNLWENRQIPYKKAIDNIVNKIYRP
jgi:hypothetical protein